MADLVNETISWLQNGEPVTGGVSGNSDGVLNRPLVQLLANDNGLQDRVDIIADDDGYYKKIISSIKITETDAATTARVQIDAAGLKQYDGTNKVFDLDEAGNVTIGYGANDKITVAAGVLAVFANELNITGASNSGITLNNATGDAITVFGAGGYGLKLGNCVSGAYGPLHMVNAGVTGAANLHSTYGSAAVDTLAVDDAHDLFIKTGASTWQKVGATASPVAVVDTATITGMATTDNSVVMDANGLTMRKAAGAVRFDVNEDGSWTLGNAAGAKVGFTTGDALSIASASLTSCSISGEQVDSGTVAAVRIADLSADKITSDEFATARIPDLSSTYAIAAKGVTNGDSHDHFEGDGAQIDHVNLSNKGSNSHSTIDSHIGASVAHSATGAVVGTTNIQILTNKRLTSPKINEDVVLTSTSTQIDDAVAESGYAVIGENTVTIHTIRSMIISIEFDYNGGSERIKAKVDSEYNGWTQSWSSSWIASGGNDGNFYWHESTGVTMYKTCGTGTPYGMIASDGEVRIDGSDHINWKNPASWHSDIYDGVHECLVCFITT